MNKLPPELIFVALAMVGGMARYFNGFANGAPFKLSILLASAFTAGFSGLMFALLGETMGVNHTVQFVMAGIGGFFGEQTLKFILERFIQEENK